MTGGKPKLRKLYRNVIGAAEDEAASHGGTIDFDLCGKHPRVHFYLCGQMRVIPFAGTPRVAAHVPTWMRQRIRQKAKEMLSCASDGSPQGQDAKQLDGEAATAGNGAQPL